MPSLDAYAVTPGEPWPLGAHVRGDGVNFALFSAHADAVDLCLFDARDGHEIARLALPACTDQVWHGHVAGIGAGTHYGYRVHGPYAPERGHRFNPHKLLVDPYARAHAGAFEWRDEHCGYTVGADDSSFDTRDNAAWQLRGVVTADLPPGDAVPRPHTAWSDTVIVEAHVKGYTALLDAVPAALRGTYAGLAHPASIERLRACGATAVELLPVHMFLDERKLVLHGLVNYWGYNSLGFFAPAPRYAASADAALEFRTMVRALHAAGLEVILDVVYNHTCEGDPRGPTLSWRGIDNAAYYRLLPDDPRHGEDLSGCGNTLHLSHPRVLQMMLDSLRYWAEVMEVDGFRFDLATALARGPGGFDAHAAVLAALRQDPVLARRKLIAEPWDVATWSTGRFPPGFGEWNDRFRDHVRSYWLTGAGSRGDLAHALTASSALFRQPGRQPQASINFVTAHDGFTLADLVSYAHKHNEDNLQHNADGNNDNRSINCGREGPTDDPAIIEQRGRLQRALLATMFVAQGVPMLTAGDEIGRTQRGNNNAYCQDGPVTWIDWRAGDSAQAAFTAACAALRRAHPAFRRTQWFDGRATACGDLDVAWLAPDGATLAPHHWNDYEQRAFGMLLGRVDAHDVALLVYFNAAADGLECRLPAAPHAPWSMLLDSSAEARLPDSGTLALPPRAVVALASAPAAPSTLA